MSKRRPGKGKHGFRKGGIERLELEALAFVRERQITRNLADGLGEIYNTAKGTWIPKVRPLEPKLGFKTSKTGSDKMVRARVPLTHYGLGPKRKPKSYLSDKELYGVKLDVTGGAKAQCMVKVGETPCHFFPLTDEDGRPLKRERDGKQIFGKTKEKPRYAVVGLQGSVPRGK